MEHALELPQFDHLLHCVPDVEGAVAAYTRAGLPAHANPPHRGFRNGAWRPDARYVEILTVEDRAAFEASPYGEAMVPWMPRIDALLAAGGGALNFAVHVADVTATTERLRRQGYAVDLHTFTSQGAPVSFAEAVLTGPDTPPWAPFFITYTPDRETLFRTYRAATTRRGPHDLAGFVIETPDPAAAAAWLARLTGLRAGGDATAPVVPLPGAHVHFAEGPADAVTALLLTDGGTPGAQEIAGLRLEHQMRSAAMRR
ncbi:VOC family protein [Streptomyces sp. NPDC049585]|uniref:VOC family protein n=1 Tax=Streptomyces sp. NPDC049585 TaxID=3155154 RepID=UPI00343F169E